MKRIFRGRYTFATLAVLAAIAATATTPAHATDPVQDAASAMYFADLCHPAGYQATPETRARIEAAQRSNLETFDMDYAEEAQGPWTTNDCPDFARRGVIEKSRTTTTQISYEDVYTIGWVAGVADACDIPYATPATMPGYSLSPSARTVVANAVRTSRATFKDAYRRAKKTANTPHHKQGCPDLVFDLTRNNEDAQRIFGAEVFNYGEPGEE